MQLVAAQGVFLQVGLRKAEDTGSEESGDRSSEGTEPESGPVRDRDSAASLAQELEQARAENGRLTGQVSNLNTKVASLTTRVNDLWRANCSLARELETGGNLFTQFHEATPTVDDDVITHYNAGIISACIPPSTRRYGETDLGKYI